ncbi:MAG: zinc metalloprotease [Candidatus Kapaibacterium sp.]|nr:MAG: zinc metalloprotease [Candidatus Kapabacteria bacterium]
METLQIIGYFILAIVPLIIVHELGHFLAARLTGTRAEIFSIGMGPRLFGWNRRDGFRWGALPSTWRSDGVTDYRLSLLPIGGYVKIAGMIDESLDAEVAAAPPQPWEFRAKNTAQKAFMVLGGIAMNLVLAWGILVGVTFSVGKTELATRTIAYVAPNSAAQQFGLRVGDEIISINGKPVSTFSDALQHLARSAYGHDVKLTVRRNERDTLLLLPAQHVRQAISQRPDLGIVPDGMRPVVLGVETLRPAGKAGLNPGDTLLSLDGQALASVEQLIEQLQARKNTPAVLVYKRSDGVHRTTITPDADGKIGVQVSNAITGEVITTHYSIGEAARAGAEQLWSYTVMLFRSIEMLITGEQSLKQSAGGPIMIARMATQTADVGAAAFLSFMAIMSLTLAVMNALPIPALDGGHLVLVLIEGVLRREIPTKVKLAYQQIGMALILALMVIVFYNDLTR